tara:strand:+ start:2309 stop:5533 length:3225 start_codon:yes stop_codon:yes gene_type:complete
MALEKGKKEVFRKTIDTQVPYVPAKSYASIAFDSLKPTLNRIQADEEKTKQANYFFDFQIKTREFFDQARIDNQFDAAAMKQTVDTYSKNLLDQVPPKYKIQAAAMLANYSMSSINYAATQKHQKDLNIKAGNRDKNWENFNTEAEFSMNNFTDHPLDSGIVGINETFINGLKTANELFHEDNINFVETNELNKKIHNKNIKTQIKNLAIARGYNIMKLMYKNNMEVEAFNWLNDLNQGADKTPLNPSREMLENPVWKELSLIMNDAQGRQEVVAGIKKLYLGFHHENIFGKSKKTNVDLDYFKQPGEILSLEKFKGGAVDSNDIAEILGIEIGSRQHTELQEYVAKANNAARVVAMSMQNPNKRINWADEDVTPELWAQSLLAMNGIHKVRFSDLDSDSFKTAINLMALQDYYPSQLADALKINNSGNWKDEGTLNKFKDQALIYQYVKNLFPNEEFPPLYEQALEGGAIDEIVNGNFSTATNIMEGIKSEDTPKRFQSIIQNENSEENFRNYLKSKKKSPNWLFKIFANEKDPLHKHLLSSADQTTIFAIDVTKIIPPAAYKEFQEIFYQTIANMTVGTEIDPWKSGNEQLLNQAWNISSRKLKQSGWGIETNTHDGKAKLVKNPYWHTYGTPDNNDKYSHIYSEFSQMSNDEKMDLFGTSKWEDIKKILYQNFNNPEGNVKISLDRRTYNDENGNPAYKLSIWQGDLVIPIEGNFKPAGWVDYSKKDSKGSMAQIVNDTTDQIYKEWEQSTWFQNLPEDKKHWSKRAIHSVIRNGIKLSDFKYYPDINLPKSKLAQSLMVAAPALSKALAGDNVTTLVAETRPFAWIAKTMGFDGDLREIQAELNAAADIANNNLSLQKKINLNRNLSDKEKINESLYPPEKMVLSNNAMSLNFKHYALTNYNNTDLRLTHRTNNWTAISSDNWDGEIPLNYKRDSRHFAVFSHPKDSIRAVTKLFLNHSTLTENINGDKVPSVYGSEPTILEILTKTKYATNMKSYIDALEDHSTLDKDTIINLMDANQMHELLKFITIHEMGSEYFNEKFGTTNAYVDSVIYAGFNEAINSYNGELGKL